MGVGAVRARYEDMGLVGALASAVLAWKPLHEEDMNHLPNLSEILTIGK
jgi:hypothetical protein